MAGGSGALLRLQGVTKAFGGVQALRGVSFDLRPGEVHALVGENGAGKSTLLKIVTGALRPDAGAIEVGGTAVETHDPGLARARGIAAIYQQPALFPDLTVAENVALGLEAGGPWRRVRWSERTARARALLARIGADIDPETTAGQLTLPEQQLVEIARALGRDARILLLDEPTAALPETEARALFRVVDELRRQGVGLVYVSHRLEELFALADRVTVLRDGASVATRPMRELDRAELIRLMVGREVSAVYPPAAGPAGDVLLELENVGCRASGVRGVSLQVRRGEILGVAGLVGAGRTELARILFGLTPADEGVLRLEGAPIVLRSPADAAARGIAYVPEDRRRHGAVLEMSVAANASLALLRSLSRAGFLDREREARMAEEAVRALSVRTPSIDAAVGTLSGGNQQKVVLARWLATAPKVLVLDEPTQGIDVGAKAEIHRLMRELAGKGMAVVMISSELPEVLGMSDRVAVLRRGTLAGVLAREEATAERVMSLALGQGRGAA
ncbi:MAG TPA: sugar ABC transporter ATP-binding protein [Salinarimonas sp.]|nr:sugar ABC transporter ATP-binding protein [Salinarimonas sp.]